MFVKTLPIRYRIVPALTFSEFSAGLHNYLLQAYNHQIYDLADMVEAMGLQNATERSLFNTMFVFHNFSEAKLYNANKFNQYEFDNNKAKYAISLIINEDEDFYNLRLEYSTLYFSRSDAELLVNHFEQLVSSFSVNPLARIMDGIGHSQTEAGINEKDILFNF
jgi:non-ribosomal peptide synthetase component F